jgi:hypothetical protein
MALAAVATVVLVWLVCLVSAQGTLIGVLVALIGASALLGMLLAARLTPSARTGVVLKVPMRDFAIASGIAAAASGPAAAAPPGKLRCPRHGLGRSGRPPSWPPASERAGTAPPEGTTSALTAWPEGS